METKYVRVPFDIEMAKKIINGELEGRIVTRDGRSARIVCWDRNSERHYHIVALLDMKVAERIFTYNVEGCEISGKEGNNDLVLEVSGIIPANYNNISTVNCNEYEIEKCEDIENESIKNDRKDDKVMMELLPWPELEEVGKVYTAGAKKYGPNKWKNLPDGYQRYKGAMLRHLTELEKGNDIDPETGCLHAAQIVWNAIAMLHCKMEEMSLKNNVCNG